MYTPPAAFLAPADSARAVGDVYSVSLLATLPVLVAMLVFFWLRHSNAGTRAVVWRCTLVGLLVIYAGRFMPWQWIAWILPELLARPMVALGTVQLGASPGIQLPAEPARSVSTIFRGLLILYWSGVISCCCGCSWLASGSWSWQDMEQVSPVHCGNRVCVKPVTLSVFRPTPCDSSRRGACRFQ
jgi:hypothetical protein